MNRPTRTDLRVRSVTAVAAQSTEAVPFVLCTGDELVDNDLSAIPKIAELCLPDHQSVWTVEGIAIFKSEDTCLAQGAVIQLQGCLIFGKVFQRRMGGAVSGIVQDGMSLTKGATLAILTRHPNGVS